MQLIKSKQYIFHQKKKKREKEVKTIRKSMDFYMILGDISKKL